MSTEMTARLTLICHAATDAQLAGEFSRDEPLGDRGLAAASALKGVYPRRRRCVSSPAWRARQTAVALGLAPETDPELRDCDFGRWTGRSLAEIASGDAAGWRAFRTDPQANPHGGESIAAVVRRVGAWLDGFPSQGSIVAVTHTAIMRAALLHVLKAPLKSFWQIDAGPLATIALAGQDGRWNFRPAVPVGGGVAEG